MTQEEKARAYDKALERASKLQENSNGMILKKWLWDVFPELKGSGDERIKKWIIDDIRYNMNNEPLNNSEYKKQAEKAIAWLEKQQKPVIFIPKFRVGDKLISTKNPRLTYEVLEVGHINELGNPEYKLEIFTDGKVENPHNIHYMECCKVDEWAELIEQKPADNKIEPKFKVGNWYQCTKDFFGKGVTFDKNTAYYCAKEGCLQDEYGCHIAIVKDLYDNFKLWTIADANDGDILATLAGAFIYNGNNGGGSCPGSYCGINTLGRFQIGVKHHWTGKKVYPATKEQRDLLFQKMKEAEYTFDFEKKELKKMEVLSKESEDENINIREWLINYLTGELEYVGNDNYNVRSDNLLRQTFHITPQQLYTVFQPTTCRPTTRFKVDN